MHLNENNITHVLESLTIATLYAQTCSHVLLVHSIQLVH